MFVIIGGGGRTGAQLATFLVAQKHEVHLIEHRREVLAHLHRELPTEVIYEGNATDAQTLELAGVERAQVLTACMAGDVDPRIQPIPIAPAAHYHMGGVATDAHGHTSLAGSIVRRRRFSKNQDIPTDRLGSKPRQNHLGQQ